MVHPENQQHDNGNNLEKPNQFEDVSPIFTKMVIF